MVEERELTAEERRLVVEKLQGAARDGGVGCKTALGIARAANLPARRVGQVADDLEIRIRRCQLGCF